MSTTYSCEEKDSAVMQIVAKQIADNHPELKKSKAKIEVCMTISDDEPEDAEPQDNEGGDAATKSDKPQNPFRPICKVKINSHADRAMGLADARITIDAKPWEKLTKPQRSGAIDQMLERIMVRDDKDGKLKMINGRPSMTIRQWDFQLRGYFETIKRNDVNSIEMVDWMSVLQLDDGQSLLGFCETGKEIEGKKAKK